MFITINNYSFCDTFSDMNICIAGVGKSGINAVHIQKILAEDMSQVDSLTMFDYGISRVSEEKNLACKRVCYDSFCLFVIADFEDENDIDSACILSDYYHVNKENVKKPLCFCITLEKYKGTNYDKQIHTCFDKVIYVEEPSLFFSPIEALFIHPIGCVGIDYDDVYHITKANNLYLFQAEDTDVSSLENKISSGIKEKLKKYNIDKFNIFLYLSLDPTMSIDVFDEFSKTAVDTALNYDSGSEHLCSFTFHENIDGIAKVSIILCDVGDVSNHKTSKEENK